MHAFTGTCCARQVRWPNLYPGERPVVWISQDESAYHSNDDQPGEWHERGKGFQIKQKSRGALLMVSKFIGELRGDVRVTPAERDAYIAAHPGSVMAQKFASDPSWDGSSQLVLEPGVAPGKDAYFDAEQLIAQTNLAMDVFEASHIAPGRWLYHPNGRLRGQARGSTYPCAYEAVWCPPVTCMGLWFFDHSSGHGAYAADALVASRMNKGPDWNGGIGVMRDGEWVTKDPTTKKLMRHVQRMQYSEGDLLCCDTIVPPGVDPNATAAGHAANVAPDVTPPTDAEAALALKKYVDGRYQTLKKHHPTMTTQEVKAMAEQDWPSLSDARKADFYKRARAQLSGQGTGAASRTLKKGTPVPQILWGRNKGLEALLTERGLYPTGGLKGSCANAAAHSDDNQCCCARLLAVQPDFAAECSALQHVVEARITITNAYGCYTSQRHKCLFLPKFHCELNWIERMWGASKQFCRANCMYSIQGLRDTVPLSLSQSLDDLPQAGQQRSDLPVSPLYLQRRWARISRQYMAEYRKGVNGCDAIRAVTGLRTKLHARHRDTSDSRSCKVEAAMAERSGGM